MLEKNQLKILVADDDAAIRLALVTMLQEEGYTTVEAVNGQEAIDVFITELPDIVLLDTVMPEKTGYDVCQYIRQQHPDILSTPIFMITVLDDPESISKAQEAGASDYLTKPISWPLLMYRMHMLFLHKKMLSEREKVDAQLRQSHKLNAIRQLTSGFAHEFNNILASQLGYTELALNLCADLHNDKLTSFLGEAQKASLRAKLLIEQLMAFSMDELELTSVSMIKDVFYESAKSLSKLVPVRIKFATQDNIDNGWIPLDFVQFHQVLMNLLENAIDSIEGDGEINIGLSQARVMNGCCSSCLEEFDGSFFVLSCEDTGSGIEEDILDRIFEPFYSTKPVGKGSGHGMSIIHGIVHAAGGHIHVDSQPGKGSVIRVFFRPVSGNAEAVA